MKYIIDTDPGIDDALSIMLGYLNGLDIVGFTVAEGNVLLADTLNNIKIVEDILDCDIKIYISKEVSTTNSERAHYAHGDNGLGDAYNYISDRKTETISQEEFLSKASKEYENNLTIIALGPLTNLARAIKSDPTIVTRVSKVIIMGTAFDRKYREFNLMMDPNSAKEVFEAGFKQIDVITHEAGIKAVIEKDYLESLEKSRIGTSRFVNKISSHYMGFSKAYHDVIGLTGPDLITIASVINPEIIEFKPCNIEIDLEDKGLSKIDLVEKSNIRISTDINLELFRKLFKETFR